LGNAECAYPKSSINIQLPIAPVMEPSMYHPDVSGIVATEGKHGLFVVREPFMVLDDRHNTSNCRI